MVVLAGIIIRPADNRILARGQLPAYLGKWRASLLGVVQGGLWGAIAPCPDGTREDGGLFAVGF